MTREERKNILMNIKRNGSLTNEERKALRLSIEDLEKEPCEDAIDRAEAMTVIMMFAGNVKSDEEDIYIKVSDAVQLLRELPSVTPQQKIGHWIEKNGFDGDTYYDCSECGESFCLIDGTPADNLYNYCPNCGAKMQEVEE